MFLVLQSEQTHQLDLHLVNNTIAQAILNTTERNPQILLGFDLAARVCGNNLFLESTLYLLIRKAFTVNHKAKLKPVQNLIAISIPSRILNLSVFIT